MPTHLRLSDPAQTAADLDGALPTDGGLVLFDDLEPSDAVAVCDALAQRRGLRFHRVDAEALVEEAFDATQGNVREAFDEARGDAVLLFIGVDALLDAPLRAGDGEPEEPPPSERLRRYLFDRAEAYDGVVALCRCPSPTPSGEAGETAAERTRIVVVTA